MANGLTAEDIAMNLRRLRKPASVEDMPGPQVDMRALQNMSVPSVAPAPTPSMTPESGSSSNETLNRALLAILPTIVGAAFGGAKGGAIGAESASKGLTQLDDTQERERQEARKRAERTEDLSFKERQVRVAERGADARDEANRLKRQEASKKPSLFTQEKQKKQATVFVKNQDNDSTLRGNLHLIDDAFKSFVDYSRSKWGGTGPLATVGGLTKYFSEPTQDLEAKFRLLNMKNMAATFQGMSRAVDSDVERRAWEATQASITNDDKVNANILLGQKSLTLKAVMENEAQRRYVAEHGDLEGYVSPIMGKTEALIRPDGEMVLVDKREVDEALQRGMKRLDTYAEEVLKKGLPASNSQGGYSPGQIIEYEGKRYRVGGDGDTLEALP